MVGGGVVKTGAEVGDRGLFIAGFVIDNAHHPANYIDTVYLLLEIDSQILVDIKAHNHVLFRTFENKRCQLQVFGQYGFYRFLYDIAHDERLTVKRGVKPVVVKLIVEAVDYAGYSAFYAGVVSGYESFDVCTGHGLVVRRVFQQCLVQALAGVMHNCAVHARVYTVFHLLIRIITFHITEIKLQGTRDILVYGACRQIFRALRSMQVLFQPGYDSIVFFNANWLVGKAPRLEYTQALFYFSGFSEQIYKLCQVS